MQSWKKYSLVSLFVVLPLLALSLFFLRPYWAPKEPARKIVSVDSAEVPVFAAGLGSAPEVEKAVEPKVDPFAHKYDKFYNKYRNKYAVLSFSNEIVELPGFDLQDEERWYVRGQEVGASPLPEWVAGQYGSIPPRRIIQILGPEEMLVAGLISEGGRLVRFRGWPTSGLRNGQVWPSDPSHADQGNDTEPLEVAVTGTYTYRTLLGDSTTVPIAVPLKLFRRGVTLEQFRNLLLTRTELPQELLGFKSELIDYEAARSGEKRPVIKQARL